MTPKLLTWAECKREAKTLPDALDSLSNDIPTWSQQSNQFVAAVAQSIGTPTRESAPLLPVVF